MSSARLRFLASLALAGSASLGHASPVDQPTPCKEGEVSLTDALRLIEEEAGRAQEEAARAQKATEASLGQWRSENPNKRAAKQTQAPSTGVSAVGPVDGASTSGLLAVALDTGLVKIGEKPSFTATLSPFAFVAAARPAVLDDQALYERDGYALLRRFDGSLSLGGPGESLDRDGDGKPDPALDAERLSDSVAWEVRVRIFGSRDYRDPHRKARWRGAVQKKLEAEVDAYATELRGLPRSASGCWSRAEFDRILAAKSQKHRLEPARVASEATQAAIQDLQEELGRSPVVTLFASGVRRDEKLGPDRTAFGVRAAAGRGAFDHTVNVDWSREEAGAGKRPTQLKIGYQATATLRALGFDDSQFSVFGAFERYSNVPAATHRTVAKAGGKLEILLAPGLTLPVSVTWANHADLLTGSDDVVGNIGIGIDLADRRKPKNAAP